MKAGDLPIYGNSIDEDKEYVLEPKPDSKVRCLLYSAIKPTRQSIEHWYETAEVIQADPVIIARGGFITVCGLGGVILGSKGGSLRQIAFGSLGTTVGIVMCYPTCSLRAMDYAWNAGTSKLIEGSEAIKRRFKS